MWNYPLNVAEAIHFWDPMEDESFNDLEETPCQPGVVGSAITPENCACYMLDISPSWCAETIAWLLNKELASNTKTTEKRSEGNAATVANWNI